jgi:hypothetical protein
MNLCRLWITRLPFLGTFKERAESLPGDHIAMCKFSNSDSLGYQRALGHIMRLIREAVQGRAKSKSAPISASVAQAPAVAATSSPALAGAGGRASVSPAEGTQHVQGLIEASSAPPTHGVSSVTYEVEEA